MKHWRTVLLGGEFKVQSLQDAPLLASYGVIDTPERVYEYLKAQLPESIRYTDNTETLIGIYLTSRRTAIGWNAISNGTLDTLLVHAREVFRALSAYCARASAAG